MTAETPLITCRIADGAPEMCGGTGREILPYWSFTKTVLAICALKLVETGALHLHRPIEGPIEGLPDGTPGGAAFTMRQLLDHTAGLPDYFTLPGYRAAVAADEEPWPRERLYAETMAQGRLFAPGAGWAYSNLGYMLVRGLIEQAAGESFATLVARVIAAPLGLKSLSLATDRADFARVPWEGAQRYHPGWVYHGCLTGTAPDAARLLHALFTGALLAPESFRQMKLRHPLGGAIEGRPWTDCGYALGLMSGRCGDAGRAIGHSGAGPFCANAVYHFPDAPRPVTVASFGRGPSEAAAEHAAARHSLG
ncbi:serine hydrolase domain-containing protein [Alloyangia pacifica]|uniref:CubicO group peptidase, beta-lactamase class C family n=1 Tax=Alloyangia pacifica TaxID=311180 RepID=A0A1I6WKW8_9RHOB|nr:serine hydrolase domain-containing protein [Alloyangia pacifica]SDI91341.1 CubicO group peptidase, beta-lactamase class C family [Alloyangia pacifica]SFT26685.1 CubicO group peptidase, beta-lactamase class C family [Alloyangia pacifica]